MHMHTSKTGPASGAQVPESTTVNVKLPELKADSEIAQEKSQIMQHARVRRIDAEQPPLLVFSHLRWDFVTQRPQHLLSRASKSRAVYFWEEPIFHSTDHEGPPGGWLQVANPREAPSVTVIRPSFHIGDDSTEGQRNLLNRFLLNHGIERFDCWYYTPMALTFSDHIHPEVTIFDCMDELSAFKNAPPQLKELESLLLERADVVFTGGHSLFEAKQTKHSNVHAFPSSVDVTHFATARDAQRDPVDQAAIPHPRAGFCGVLDERFDIALVSEVTRLMPDVHFVFIGPIAKIDPSSLPHGENVHYLGMKSYKELPSYLAGWDACILPFALNESTRFISPTKTPEYLAAGKRVVSTPIKDVVVDYGLPGLVEIAASPVEFAAALDRSINAEEDEVWSQAVAIKLAASSWDKTWAAMQFEIDMARSAKLDRLMTKERAFDIRSQSESYDYLVVGAGFAGGVVAERLASQLGKRVLIIDKRPHVGGNTYDFYNEDGILVHLYGPHIFHTSSQMVVDYLSKFTEWRPYEHRVLASVDGKLLPVPINLDTINGLYGTTLDAEGMESFLAERAEPRDQILTSEDIVVSKLGRELYEKFFQNYTRKQWGLDPSQLDRSVAGRIPVRFNRDDRYFSDTFQAMPLKGFTYLFERMLSHPGIDVKLSTDYHEEARRYPQAKVIYTGPIDEFFDYCFGPLPYRSLRFEHKTLDCSRFQPVGVVNYPNDHLYTRITEFKHLTGQKHTKTSIVYEYPCDEGDPYYPIPRPENSELYARYRALAEATPGVYFCGRLANYRYFNMDQVVAQALHLFREIADGEQSSVALPINAATLDRISRQAKITSLAEL